MQRSGLAALPHHRCVCIWESGAAGGSFILFSSHKGGIFRKRRKKEISEGQLGALRAIKTRENKHTKAAPGCSALPLSCWWALSICLHLLRREWKICFSDANFLLPSFDKLQLIWQRNIYKSIFKFIRKSLGWPIWVKALILLLVAQTDVCHSVIGRAINARYQLNLWNCSEQQSAQSHWNLLWISIRTRASWNAAPPLGCHTNLRSKYKRLEVGEALAVCWRSSLSREKIAFSCTWPPNSFTQVDVIAIYF